MTVHACNPSMLGAEARPWVQGQSGLIVRASAGNKQKGEDGRPKANHTGRAHSSRAVGRAGPYTLPSPKLPDVCPLTETSRDWRWPEKAGLLL